MARSKQTVAGAATLYRAYRQKKRKADNTVRAGDIVINQFTKQYGDKQFQSITERHIEAFFDYLIDRVQESTYNSYMQRFRSFLAWSHEEKYCAHPAELLRRVEKRQVPEKDRLRFTREETQAIMCMDAHPVDKALLAVLLNTCCRISDLRHMTVGCIDKTEARWKIALYRPKTKTFTWVRMTPILQGCMELWLAYYEAECGPLSSMWPLIPAKMRPKFEIDPDTGRFRPQTMTKLNPARSVGEADALADRAFEAAGRTRDKGERWHTFRRTGARNLYDTLLDSGQDSGRAIKVVQLLLGHKDEQTTWLYLGFAREWDLLDKALMNFDFVGTDTGFKGAPTSQPPTPADSNVIDMFSRKRTG